MARIGEGLKLLEAIVNGEIIGSAEELFRVICDRYLTKMYTLSAHL